MWRCSNSHTYASANADTRGMKPWIVSSRLGRSRRAGAERSVPPLRRRWAPRTPCLFLVRCCLLLCRNWRTSTAPRRRCAELSRLRWCALWFSSSDSAWLVGRKHGRLPHSQPPDKGVDRKRGRDQQCVGEAVRSRILDEHKRNLDEHQKKVKQTEQYERIVRASPARINDLVCPWLRTGDGFVTSIMQPRT